MKQKEFLPIFTLNLMKTLFRYQNKINTLNKQIINIGIK